MIRSTVVGMKRHLVTSQIREMNNAVVKENEKHRCNESFPIGGLGFWGVFRVKRNGMKMSGMSVCTECLLSVHR